MFKHMYEDLERCCQCLQSDVDRSLQQLIPANFDEDVEAKKDYHYKEILNQLKLIKEHIKTITTHHKALQTLERSSIKIDKEYIKKQVESFQNLDNVHRRSHRPVRPAAISSMKLLECWEQHVQQQEGNDFTQVLPCVLKRPDGVRKNKKVVSSTVDLLEFDYDQTRSLESLNEEHCVDEQETVESVQSEPSRVECCINGVDESSGKEQIVIENENVCVNEVTSKSCDSVESAIKDPILHQTVDTKPRIVDVIYKKNADL